MQKNGVSLYYLTAGWALLSVATGLYFLFLGTTPTADVKARYKNAPGTVQIGNWEPGDAKLLNIKGKPVVIWRRSRAEMALASAQFYPRVPVEDWSEALSTGALERELGAEAFARLEWFIASPISTAGFGCIVLTKAGDYEGFFDPCAGAHFDMWGRPKKGPTNENLKVPYHRFGEFGQHVVIDVSGLPAPR